MDGSGGQPRLEHLSKDENEHLERARRLLERTDLIADKPGRGVNHETLYEGRYAARGVILLAQALNHARRPRDIGALTQQVADSFGDIT